MERRTRSSKPQPLNETDNSASRTSVRRLSRDSDPARCFVDESCPTQVLLNGTTCAECRVRARNQLKVLTADGCSATWTGTCAGAAAICVPSTANRVGLQVSREAWPTSITVVGSGLVDVLSPQSFSCVSGCAFLTPPRKTCSIPSRVTRR